MLAIGRHFRLAENQGSLGPSWTEDGLALAGVALLQRTRDGFALRPVDHLEALLKAAYDRDLDPGMVRGLKVAAESLNQGDTARAMIAALHLRLPPLSPERAGKLAQVDDALAKYNADQPRDWHGRWTDGDSAGPDLTAPDTAHEFQGEGGNDEEGEPPPMGDNLPRGGPRAGEPEDPVFRPEKVPEGWDKPEYRHDGKYYAPVRLPVLPNGMPWPTVTVDFALAALRPQPGVGKPYLRVFVPQDGIGPELVGSGPGGDYKRPSGYDEVMLRGSPQSTPSRGAETSHARDGVVEALKLASTNEFSDIYFNTSLSTIDREAYALALRPDVVAVARPGVNLEPRLQPFENWSPSQSFKDRAARLGQLNSIPGLRPAYGKLFKLAVADGVLLLRYLGSH